MKKIFATGVTILILLMSLTGCGDEPVSTAESVSVVERVSAADILDNEAPARIVAEYSRERELRVHQNFLAWLHENVSYDTDRTLDDVTVFRYYGTFDGREVVFMD
ncbi:MAG: hypothetical protein FWD01_04970, partial [Defluviitaleaceae bacterium]|nr:hypothetical protein [Defluviitaleaceae bacterium]